MLVPERWPEIPSELAAANIKFNKEIAALPVYGPGFFTDRQLLVAEDAAREVPEHETADRLKLSHPAAVSRHRTAALAKISEGGVAVPRLVYVCLDSALLEYTLDPQPVELTPVGAIALKGVFLGYDGVQIANETPGVVRKDVRAEISGLRDFLGVTTDAGLVRRAYQVGLCTPRVKFVLPGPEEYRFE